MKGSTRFTRIFASDKEEEGGILCVFVLPMTQSGGKKSVMMSAALWEIGIRLLA